VLKYANPRIRISADISKEPDMLTNQNDRERQIQVRIVTTSGSYPKHGHEAVPSMEPLSAVLARAATALNIADTSQWVAKIGGNEVDVSRTYAELGLHGEVKIDYGKREGGGGHAPSLGPSSV
jgi:hypothetical protein